MQTIETAIQNLIKLRQESRLTEKEHLIVQSDIDFLYNKAKEAEALQIRVKELESK